MAVPNIECPKCGSIMIPIWFTEKEVNMLMGIIPIKQEEVKYEQICKTKDRVYCGERI